MSSRAQNGSDRPKTYALETIQAVFRFPRHFKFCFFSVKPPEENISKFSNDVIHADNDSHILAKFAENWQRGMAKTMQKIKI